MAAPTPGRYAVRKLAGGWIGEVYAPAPHGRTFVPCFRCGPHGSRGRVVSRLTSYVRGRFKVPLRELRQIP